MSAEPPPSGDLIKQSTEALSAFVRWVAELIVSKNWFTLLILVAIANLFLFKPESGIALKGMEVLFGKIPPAPWYGPLFWAVEGGLLLGALAIAVRTLPRAAQNAPVHIPDYKAIKGLRPFTQEDAEVFAQLQRQGMLRECIDSVTSAGFRFGILHGVSGCGKTSFLQAGIIPRLTAADATHRGIYVRLGGQDPVRAIASALSTALEIPSEWLQSDTSSPGFQTLLNSALNAAGKPLILFLDQFEQFFVYYPREDQRQPFVQALTAWYTDPQPLAVSFVVSVRSDLLYQLDELHKALGYALGPQEVFRLEKFSPVECANVLKAIAQLENLSFDARFITELAQAELGDREDGRISPVDVQILAWMIEQQPQGELRAFDRNAFQKFGGVEGLLQRFLERTLDARMLPNQRQTALKVLLALTDCDRQVRAGILTITQLTQTLKDTLTTAEVTEAVQWLSRGDVRLITPQERDGIIGYELAHERLIPALLRQTQKELTDVERARQLLDRRVNEWLGNQRDSRYFFNFRELWLIRKQRPYIDWGAKREQKEKLIRLSQRRVYGPLAALISLIGVTGWLWFTPSGQLQGLYWQLDRELTTASADEVATAAIAFAKNDQWDKALGLTQSRLQPQGNSLSATDDAAMSRFIEGAADVLIKSTLSKDIQRQKLQQLTERTQAIQDDRSKSSALTAIATAAAQLDDGETAAKLLQNALNNAQGIANNEFKSDALSAIAMVAAQLDDGETAAKLLQNALNNAQGITDNESKSNALRGIATVAAQLDDSETAVKLLQNALTSAQDITDDFYKSFALSAIATACAQLGDGEMAAKLLKNALISAQSITDDFYKFNALSAIAMAAAQLADQEMAVQLLQNVLKSAQDITDDRNQFRMLSAIATVAAQLEDNETAAKLLQNALTSAQGITDNESKSNALRGIATAAAQLDDEEMAATLLQNALISVQDITDGFSKSDVLSVIATAAAQLDDDEMATNLLQNALTSAQDITDDRSKSEALRDIAIAAAQLKDGETATNLLQNALTSAQDITDDNAKSNALRDIVIAAAQLDNGEAATKLMQNALNSAQSITDAYSKSDALSYIATASWSLGPIAQQQSLFDEIEDVAQRGKHGEAIVQIVYLYAKQEQWNRALSLLQDYRYFTSVIEMLTIRAESRNPRLIDGAVVLSATAEANDLKVEIQSPDQSCDQRVVWWEVITPDGELLERQLLNTIHRDSQPFTSQLSVLNINPNQEVLIRAYFQGSYGVDRERRGDRAGYTDQALRGSLATGFKSVRISPDFARWLEREDPQPGPCEK